MKFTTLTKQEFTQFAETHPLVTFHQTVEWGNLKKKTAGNHIL